jgi:hypothetical protein
MKNVKIKNPLPAISIKTAVLILLMLSIVMSVAVVMTSGATPATVPVPENAVSGTACTMPSPFEPDELLRTFAYASGFPQVIQVGIDPAISLSILSVVGMVHNYSWIDLGDSNFVHTAAGLPTSNWFMVILLVLFALTRSGLDLTRVSALLDEAFLARANEVLGAVMTVVMSFAPVYGRDSAVAEYVTMSVSNNFSATAILAVLGFVSAVLGLATFAVIQSLMGGINAAIFIFGLIPGSFQILKLCKSGGVILYALLCAFLAPAAVALGVMILITAILLFRIMRRLECYYKQIYVKPFINSVYKWAFRKNKEGDEFPLVIKKLPKFVRETFPEIKICQEAFVLRGIPNVPVRERVYLIHDGTQTHICWRKWYYFGWNVAGINMDALYGDPQFRFLMLYTVGEHFLNIKGEPDDKKTLKHAKVKIVLRRELNEQFDFLKVVLRFHESPLNVERRRKAAEKECKREQKRLLKSGAMY